MSFYTALSGLKASQTDLAVISNNIANVGTTGFKRSGTEFGDLVSSSPMQSSGIAGQGTRLRGIAQQFTQGGLESSERSLDLAISGQGFFVTRASNSNGQVSYTRNGAFSVDANRFLTDSAGAICRCCRPTPRAPSPRPGSARRARSSSHSPRAPRRRPRRSTCR
ncbi:flagellar hook-basal body complex protein [Rhizorhabdus histidinilytica]